MMDYRKKKNKLPRWDENTKKNEVEEGVYFSEMRDG